jgi:hypothetical protein
VAAALVAGARALCRMAAASAVAAVAIAAVAGVEA